MMLKASNDVSMMRSMMRVLFGRKSGILEKENLAYIGGGGGLEKVHGWMFSLRIIVFGKPLTNPLAAITTDFTFFPFI